MSLTEDQLAAFLNDVAYLREIVGHTQINEEEITRLSVLLRRLLIDRDLDKICTPRLGNIMLLAPDLRAFHRMSAEHSFELFISGEVDVLGSYVSHFSLVNIVGDTSTKAKGGAAVHDHVPGGNKVPPEVLRKRDELLSKFKTARHPVSSLSLDQFCQQKVICYKGTWITRETTIKYLADVASGAHSDRPKETDYALLAQMRSATVVSIVNGRLHAQVLTEEDNFEETVIKRSPDALDLVLVEILATASHLTRAPMIADLEAIIRKELLIDDPVRLSAVKNGSGHHGKNMGIVTLHGRVWPSTVDFNLDTTSISKVDDFSQKPFSAKVSIKNNQITVTIEVDSPSESDMDSWFTEGYVLTRTCLNILSFYHAIAFTATFESSSINGGEPKPFMIGKRELAGACTAYHPRDLRQISNLLLTDTSAALALNDLISSVSFPSNGVVSCARAVEGIRHLISPSTNREKQWRALKTALNVDQEYLQLILAHAIPPRHGDHTQKISILLFSEIVTRSWTLMNRYFEYRKGGDKPLQPPTFPLLKG